MKIDSIFEQLKDTLIFKYAFVITCDDDKLEFMRQKFKKAHCPFPKMFRTTGDCEQSHYDLTQLIKQKTAVCYDNSIDKRLESFNHQPSACKSQYMKELNMKYNYADRWCQEQFSKLDLIANPYLFGYHDIKKTR